MNKTTPLSLSSQHSDTHTDTKNAFTISFYTFPFSLLWSSLRCPVLHSESKLSSLHASSVLSLSLNIFLSFFPFFHHQFCWPTYRRQTKDKNKTSWVLLFWIGLALIKEGGKRKTQIRQCHQNAIFSFPCAVLSLIPERTGNLVFLLLDCICLGLYTATERDIPCLLFVNLLVRFPSFFCNSW